MGMGPPQGNQIRRVRRAAARRALLPLAIAAVGVVLVASGQWITGWTVIGVAVAVALSLVFLEVGYSEDREREREGRERPLHHHHHHHQP